jgi:hypothetical protein
MRRLERRTLFSDGDMRRLTGCFLRIVYHAGLPTTENGRKQPSRSSVTLSRLVWGNPSVMRMLGQVKTLLPVAATQRGRE